MITQVYAPNIHAEAEVDESYSQIPSEIDRLCKQDVLLVVGDLECQCWK